MAIIQLSKGADPQQVAAKLRLSGITVGQKLPGGRMVAYIKPNKIALSDLLDNLQELMHYTTPHVAFNALLYGWRVQRGHTTEWLHELRKRNFISVHLAEDFARYCLQDDWQKMMPN